MTTAIFFDVDGTLLQFDRPYEDVLQAVFEERLGHSSDAMVERYDEAFFEAFEACEPAPTRQAMAAVVDTLDTEFDVDALVEALQTAEQRATTTPAGTEESLQALGEDNYLGVITNGVTDWQTAKLAHHGLDGYFETVVSSYDVGTHKPDSAPFEAARERVDAETYVMVGDDYEADVEGARAAGFVPVHVDSEDGAGFWATLQAMA